MVLKIPVHGPCNEIRCGAELNNMGVMVSNYTYSMSAMTISGASASPVSRMRTFGGDCNGDGR